MYFGIDPLYWMMMLPVMLISILASLKVKMSFSKYSKVGLNKGMTGAEVAKTILRAHGLTNVKVEEHQGFLSDHYDPSQRVIKLSPEVYRSTSVAAAGVAAHETGHALQHSTGYAPLALRNSMVPVASLGSNLSLIIIIAGFVFGWLGLVKIGIVIFSLVVFFQLITLPVEFNASARAKKFLVSTGITSRETEIEGVNSVLAGAAMTYVAAAASSIMTLLYFLLRSGILGGRSRD